MAKAAKKTTKKVVTKTVSKVTVKDQAPSSSEITVTRSAVNKKTLVRVALIIGGGLLVFAAYRWAVLAWVDQTPITRWQVYSQLEARYGKDLVDQLVTEPLITNEAKNRKVVVSNDEVGSEVKKLEDQQGGSDKLDQVLSFQGMTRQELEKQISYQLLIKRMFGEGVSVSDEELNQYVESNKEQLGEVDEKTKLAIKERLLMQKIGQSFNEWLNQNKAGSRVVRYTN